MQPITGPMAESLKRQRAVCNAKFDAAAKIGRPIDGPAFLSELATTVDPIVKSVAGVFAEKVDAVTLALYSVTLELFSAALLGPQAKSPIVQSAWRQILPKIPRLMARDPERLAGSVTNAVSNLAATDGTRPERWIQGMIEVAPHCAEPQTFLDCGKFLAWREGMAQFRDDAIAVARKLKPDLGAKLLGLPQPQTAPTIQSVFDKITENPWITPADALTGAHDPHRLGIKRTAGAFRGFGGSFLRPPCVATVDGNILVFDGEGAWIVYSDIFGVYFHRVETKPPKATCDAEGVILSSPGRITWGEASNAFYEFSAGASSAACNGKTLAVTIPTSHQIFLLARG